MITRIELTNFMSHEHTVIEPAAGLTVMIGPNNCGKSAIVAALQILCSNENSTYVMRHGAKDCSVKVETDDGHTIEWRRKNSPSYVIDGQKFDRLRGSGLPDELHAALRLPKVEAGDDNDFDVHFGTQKSPIFLLGGSSANAARFFASSSDAIRLVEMQKRHKDKLAEAQREKTRLEAESKKVNAALVTLEPVLNLEERLEAASDVYEELKRLANLVVTAEKVQAELRSHSATVEKYAAQTDALCNLPQPPVMGDTAPLQALIAAITVAQGGLRAAASRAEALSLLPSPPSLTPIGLLEGLIKATVSEHVRRGTLESQSQSLSILQPLPKLHELAALDRLIAGIVQTAGNHKRFKEQTTTLSPVCSPPQLSDIEPLRQCLERLVESADELAARRSTSKLLGVLREPPHLADEPALGASLVALQRASRHLAHWEAKSATLASIAAAPATMDSSAVSDLVRRMEESEKQVRTCDSAIQRAVSNLSAAAADLRFKVEGSPCPICGTILDAEKVIDRATVGFGGHEHA